MGQRHEQFVFARIEDGQWRVDTSAGSLSLTTRRRHRYEILPTFGSNPKPVPVHGGFEDIVAELQRLVAAYWLADASAQDAAIRARDRQRAGERRWLRLRVAGWILVVLVLPVVAVIAVRTV